MADTLDSKFVSSSGDATAMTDALSSGPTTVLNFTIVNNSATTNDTFDVYIRENNSGTTSNWYYIYKSQPIPFESTFEHTDKIILEATDVLYYDPAGSVQIEAITAVLKQP